MALKDVKKYFLKIQDTYMSCKENEAEMIIEYKKGNISQEQADNYQKYVNELKLNYDRLAYIMYLFKLPNKQSKKNKYYKSNETLNNYFKENKATQEDIELENEDILKKLQKIIKKEDI